MFRDRFPAKSDSQPLPLLPSTFPFPFLGSTFWRFLPRFPRLVLACAGCSQDASLRLHSHSKVLRTTPGVGSGYGADITVGGVGVCVCVGGGGGSLGVASVLESCSGACGGSSLVSQVVTITLWQTWIWLLTIWLFRRWLSTKAWIWGDGSCLSGMLIL
jgi:hypothetical protein